MRTGLRERRQRGRDHDGGGVFDGDGLRRNGHAHALQHVGQALRGEDGLFTVAGTVEADDQAVADELIVAHTFERDQFFQARGGARG